VQAPLSPNQWKLHDVDGPTEYVLDGENVLEPEVPFEETCVVLVEARAHPDEKDAVLHVGRSAEFVLSQGDDLSLEVHAALGPSCIDGHAVNGWIALGDIEPDVATGELRAISAADLKDIVLQFSAVGAWKVEVRNGSGQWFEKPQPASVFDLPGKPPELDCQIEGEPGIEQALTCALHGWDLLGSAPPAGGWLCVAFQFEDFWGYRSRELSRCVFLDAFPPATVYAEVAPDTPVPGEELRVTLAFDDVMRPESCTLRLAPVTRDAQPLQFAPPTAWGAETGPGMQDILVWSLTLPPEAAGKTYHIKGHFVDWVGNSGEATVLGDNGGPLAIVVADLRP
jgi:hypothetical protein